jgi:hypothetical protein
LMLNLVYTAHPVVDSYARENITYECVNVMGQRQGRHNILWFAFIAWQSRRNSTATTMACDLFNIIVIMTLRFSHAFCASRPPHPPLNRAPLYLYITPELETL